MNILSITEAEFNKAVPPRPQIVPLKEVAFYRTENKAVYGVIPYDVGDEDYQAIVLGRDEKGVYRCFDLKVSIPKLDEATRTLHDMMTKRAATGQNVFPQGSEVEN